VKFTLSRKQFIRTSVDRKYVVPSSMITSLERKLTTNEKERISVTNYLKKGRSVLSILFRFSKKKIEKN